MSRKRKEQLNSENQDDFEVIISQQNSDNDETIIITSEERGKQWLENAMTNFDPTNKTYSAYLSDGINITNKLTMDMLCKLSISPQSNINDIKIINSIIRQYINKGDMIGKTYETIESNVNTDYNLSYNDFSSGRNKQKVLDRTKELVTDFNTKINIKNFIRKSIPLTYSEGTYCCYLRKDNKNNYVVDYYPLGVCLVSDYDCNGEPYLLIDVNELTNRLRKITLKNKKGQALFFNTIDDDMKANYPPEVYQAYLNKDQYVKLDIRYSGIIRIGNLNRKYGLTPMFRALKPTLMLEQFENTDMINAQAKGKKIIHQILRKELMGADYSKKGFEEMAYAHKNFMEAWKRPTVVVTTPPFVESIKYVEPSTENVNVDTINYYKSQQLLSLGITFLASDKGQTVTTASISVKELVKNIDKITEQVSDLLNKWYRTILIDNGIDIQYAPTISINSSEQLSMEMKQQLAEFLFTKMSASFETCYSVLGIDVDDELQKRKSENDSGFNSIFEPHPISFTLSGNDQGGRPSGGEDQNKQQYDKTRNDAK